MVSPRSSKNKGEQQEKRQTLHKELMELMGDFADVERRFNRLSRRFRKLWLASNTKLDGTNKNSKSKE